MKDWVAPTVETLDVHNTGHTIKWFSGQGWCKWNGTGWHSCGSNYQPGSNDVIVGSES